MNYNVIEVIDAAKIWGAVALWIMVIIAGLSVAAVAIAPA